MDIGQYSYSWQDAHDIVTYMKNVIKSLQLADISAIKLMCVYVCERKS